jgi:hypothetical protein
MYPDDLLFVPFGKYRSIETARTPGIDCYTAFEIRGGFAEIKMTMYLTKSFPGKRCFADKARTCVSMDTLK